MSLSKLTYIQSRIFEIRPIDSKSEAYGITVNNDEAMEQLLDWVTKQTTIDVTLYPDGSLRFEEYVN